MGVDREAASHRPFPLNVVPVPGGWGVAIFLENGECKQLLKPGWHADNNKPYQFASEQDAWNFIKQLFNFCLQQAQMQFTGMDRIINCTQCGRVFKSKLFEYCHQCLQENEFMIQQLWQGLYYLAGSEERALEKAAFLLKIPYDDFAHVPDAFKVMVQKHLALNAELEKLKEPRFRASSSAQPANAKVERRIGLHSSGYQSF